MKKVIILLLFLSGCASQKVDHVKDDMSVVDSDTSITVIDVNNRKKVIKAVVENPYPTCKSELSVARLDRKPTKLVYIDTSSGEVCKRESGKSKWLK